MFNYGFEKIFPLQFGRLTPGRLTAQFGDFSPFDVLWSFMAASSAYTIFSGVAEVLGGMLLLIPRLTTVGAMVCSAVLSNVFMLNMCYDVPVKLFSFHLLLMSLFLLAPELPRIADLLVFHRAVSPPESPSLSNRRWINKGVPIVYGILGLFFFCSFCLGEWRHYSKREAAAKPPFYGVWIVDELTKTGDPNSLRIRL